jgi:hypothetical protein
MNKAHLFEAVCLVNQGIDIATRGVQRLDRGDGIELDSMAEALANFEKFRSRVNLQFFGDIRVREQKDLKRFSDEADCYAESPLDHPEHVYELVRFVERQRKHEGKPPLVVFLDPENTDENKETNEDQNNENPKPAKSPG